MQIVCKNRWAKQTVGGLFALLCIAQILSFFPQLWIGDILAEFSLHCLLGFSLALIMFLMMRRYRIAMVAATGMMLNALVMLPFFYPSPMPCAHCNDQALQIVQFNAFFKNKKVADFVEWANQDKDTQVIIVIEAQTNAAMLEPLKTTYPYFAGSEERYPSGLAIFSRLPLQDVQWVRLLPDIKNNHSVLSANIDVAGETLHLFAVHPPYSLTPAQRQQRSDYFSDLVKMVQHTSSGYRMIVGDFNTSPFHPAFKKIATQSSMRNAQVGLGFFPSWHLKKWNFPLFGLMLDNMLISENIHVDSRVKGDDFGSDHVPVITRLRFEKP